MIIIRAICYLIDIISILIVVRSVLSWLPLGGDNAINNFLITMTEPVIAPVRKLLYKFEFSREMPVDFAPVIAIIFLYIISMVLSAFIPY